ncbi:MAG TPA: superoxide dismutase [Balneolaceae bacterium]|nr:superoxide dismutase [Balneolaceae bacterium]
MSYKLPELPYEYDALEPVIDAQTMEIHHTKHHQGYTDKVNAALKGHDFADLPIEEVLQRIDEVPEKIRQAVINNGGGYANHKLFWTILSPNGGGEPGQDVGDAISEAYGSFEDFKTAFSDAATSQFGSGWGWLCVDNDGELVVLSTANQNSPYMDGLTPVLGVDVWEHAYYLNYQNERGTYVDNFWKLVNWDQVNEYYIETQ